jgi:hypothetical protein
VILINVFVCYVLDEWIELFLLNLNKVFWFVDELAFAKSPRVELPDNKLAIVDSVVNARADVLHYLVNAESAHEAEDVHCLQQVRDLGSFVSIEREANFRLEHEGDKDAQRNVDVEATSSLGHDLHFDIRLDFKTPVHLNTIKFQLFNLLFKAISSLLVFIKDFLTLSFQLSLLLSVRFIPFNVELVDIVAIWIGCK